tara:strand:+ start:362 stop:577 length:216 start_codon:yes stop_codon:yes gene_type:complete
MRNTNCIFNWEDEVSGKVKTCSQKTKYSGDVYHSSKEGVRSMPMIDYEFCQDHYNEGVKNPEYKFKNVKRK